MRKFMVLAFASFFLVATAPAFAGGHDCDDKSGRSMQKDCDSKQDDCGLQCPVASKVMKKAHFFLSNSDAIGLSEEQVTKIKTIKWDVKKQMIRAGAEMQIGMGEMEAKLSEPTVDVEGLNSMIDKGTAEWAAGGKKMVAAYAELKAVLTPEQMAKAKEIWVGKKK